MASIACQPAADGGTEQTDPIQANPMNPNTSAPQYGAVSTSQQQGQSGTTTAAPQQGGQMSPSAQIQQSGQQAPRFTDWASI
ncbi:hypothetical protein [Roseicyclus marinus]|uniref:hypothetical protein n=1 Tax=Roseicyclus marinus TaxID=2161673 RepID=UPI00240F17EA|nr:hypothetical protein [Roseicyclus marinus]MDG3040511.1 hypothetical protein [Roseicyclus marinus]